MTYDTERKPLAIAMAVAGAVAIVMIGAAVLARQPSYSLSWIDPDGERWIIDHALTLEDCVPLAADRPFRSCEPEAP